MNADDPVRQALEALRADDATLRVSKRVEEAVFSAFEAHSRQGANRGMPVAMAAVAILAAAVLYALVLALPNLAPARKGPVAGPATAERPSQPRIASPAIDSSVHPPSVNSEPSSSTASRKESDTPRVTV